MRVWVYVSARVYAFCSVSLHNNASMHMSVNAFFVCWRFSICFLFFPPLVLQLQASAATERFLCNTELELQVDLFIYCSRFEEVSAGIHAWTQKKDDHRGK